MRLNKENVFYIMLILMIIWEIFAYIIGFEMVFTIMITVAMWCCFCIGWLVGGKTK